MRKIIFGILFCIGQVITSAEPHNQQAPRPGKKLSTYIAATCASAALLCATFIRTNDTTIPYEEFIINIEHPSNNRWGITCTNQETIDECLSHGQNRYVCLPLKK